MIDPTIEEMERTTRESLEAFKRLPQAEQLARLVEYGILGPDGHLALRYSPTWDGDVEEVLPVPAK